MPSIRRTSFLGSNLAAQMRLREAYSRVSDANTKVATGRSFQRASQNVPAASRVALLQDQADRLAVYDRSISDATARLGFADDVLGQAMTSYHRLTELGVQAGNPLTNADSRQAIRQEVIEIRKALEDLANTRYLGEPIFAGYSGENAVRFDTATSTWAFRGDDTERIERRVGQSETVRVNVTAQEAFSVGGRSIFEMLDDLAASLSSGDQAATVAAVGELSGFRSALSAAQAHVGTAAQIVERAGLRNTSLGLRLEEEIANVRDVDLADAITDQQRLQIAYEAAIATTGKSQSTSLLDWLR